MLASTTVPFGNRVSATRCASAGRKVASASRPGEISRTSMTTTSVVVDGVAGGIIAAPTTSLPLVNVVVDLHTLDQLLHDGSDTDFLRAAVGDSLVGIGLKVGKAMQDSLADTSNWSNRPLDVTFALDELNRRNGQTGDELFGKLDLSRVGMSGHSFGAYTTMLIMGALIDLPGQHDLVQAAARHRLGGPLDQGTPVVGVALRGDREPKDRCR